MSQSDARRDRKSLNSNKSNQAKINNERSRRGKVCDITAFSPLCRRARERAARRAIGASISKREQQISIDCAAIRVSINLGWSAECAVPSDEFISARIDKNSRAARDRVEQLNVAFTIHIGRRKSFRQSESNLHWITIKASVQIKMRKKKDEIEGKIASQAHVSLCLFIYFCFSRWFRFQCLFAST